MADRNRRTQETNRIKGTINRIIRSNQTFDNRNSQVNGFRSLAFYQAERYVVDSNNMTVGNHSNTGNTVG